jgi:proline dehydrogenase
MARRRFARRAVRRFMPGEKAEDALRAARSLADQKIGTVLTQLGENLTSLDDAAQVRDHYIGLLETVKTLALPSWPSVKPTQLGVDLSFDACLANCEAIAAKAESAGSLLWIDMEDSSYVDRTLELFRRLRQRHERVGLALQAYLYRTPTDLEALLPLRPVIRLVKGAYNEPPTVAFPAKRKVDAAYFDLAGRLLEAAARDGCFPVFGTHDMRLVSLIARRAADLNLTDGRYEIHMLYGIRPHDQRRLVSEGRVVRTLISYGSAWFPWYMRRLAERPANVWFVVRSMLAS